MSTPVYPGPTEPMIGALLRLASDASHRVLLERLRAAGYGDMRFAHIALFKFPGPHGVRPTDLAEHVGLSKQALNPLLNELEELGYLKRQAGSGDRRHRVLELTPRGLAFAAEMKSVLEGMEEDIVLRIGSRRFDQTRRAIIEMTDLFAAEALSNNEL
jgi:DNA-binding MarR family transcriptional regulator